VDPVWPQPWPLLPGLCSSRCGPRGRGRGGLAGSGAERGRSARRRWRTDLPRGACLLISISVEHDKLPAEAGVKAVVLTSQYLIEPSAAGRSRVTHICRADLRYGDPWCGLGGTGAALRAWPGSAGRAAARCLPAPRGGGLGPGLSCQKVPGTGATGSVSQCWWFLLQNTQGPPRVRSTAWARRSVVSRAGLQGCTDRGGRGAVWSSLWAGASPAGSQTPRALPRVCGEESGRRVPSAVTWCSVSVSSSVAAGAAPSACPRAGIVESQSH